MTAIHDFRHAWRALRAHVVFTASIVATLGLALGANAAVFSLVNAVILAPLPFPDPSRIMLITQTRVDSVNEPLSISDYRDLRDGSSSFEVMATAFQWGVNLTGGEAERIQGMRASASLVTLLGLKPALGRLLVPADETGAGTRVVVLTHRLWTRRFGASPAAVGSSIVLNGDSYAIVGVLPPSIPTPIRDAELIAPFPMDSDARRTNRDAGFLRVLGRLKPGVTLAQARGDLDAIMARLRVEYPATNATHMGTFLVEWRSALGATQRPTLLLLQAAVILVLVVACANVGNLFLAAATRREHEFAVRAALGASRARRVRQVIFETLLIAFAAGVAGLLLHGVIAGALAILAPPDLLAVAPPGIFNLRVLLFTAGAAFAAAAMLAPMAIWRLGSAPASLSSARASSRATRALRRGLVVAEVALASMLITVAVVLSQSFARLQSVDPGFRSDHLLTARLSLPRGRYPRSEEASRFVDTLRPKLLAIPGVEDAAAVNVVPLNGFRATADVWPADRPLPPPSGRANAQYRMISPSYVRTFRVPLIAGRSLDEHDDAGAEPVVLISRTLAQRYWTVADAVGQYLTIEDGGGPRRARVVGVVGDVKHYGFDAEVTPDVYTAIPQVPDQTVQWLLNSMYWGIRTSGDPEAIREQFRRALREVDPDVPAATIRTMDQALEVAFGARRANVVLVRAFAGIALLLAAVGVYAVTAFTVALRRREIAIRSALGAAASRNAREVIVDAAGPMLAGVLLGAAGTLAVAPALRAVVFEVDPFSPAPFAMVAGTLLVSGLMAAVVGAMPIRSIDPLDALRTE